MTQHGPLDQQPAATARGAATASRAARLRTALADDAGAVTAEYAIVLLAAVAFAGLLVTIVRSGEVKQVLTDLIRQALSVG